MADNKNNKDGKSFWNKILNTPRILSDEEADSMLEIVKNLRKEHGFRKITKVRRSRLTAP